jgi:hypothetical protein
MGIEFWGTLLAHLVGLNNIALRRCLTLPPFNIDRHFSMETHTRGIDSVRRH